MGYLTRSPYCLRVGECVHSLVAFWQIGDFHFDALHVSVSRSVSQGLGVSEIEYYASDIANRLPLHRPTHSLGLRTIDSVRRSVCPPGYLF